MAKESTRITPFNFNYHEVSEHNRAKLQRGSYAIHNMTNHDFNELGLRTWNREHRQVWELEHVGNDTKPLTYDLRPYGLHHE